MDRVGTGLGGSEWECGHDRSGDSGWEESTQEVKRGWNGVRVELWAMGTRIPLKDDDIRAEGGVMS